MHIIKSMLSAFLMYSRIPVPQVEWKEENRRYAFCFFPLIGAVSGILLFVWQLLCRLLGAQEVWFGAGAVIIPVLVTGGIHLDGFCDVIDAKSSCGDRQKLLEIMSDPHIGAFAAIRLCLLFLIQFACFWELSGSRRLWIAAIGYVLSRALSGLAAVTFKGAKTDGSLQSFAKPAYRKRTVAVLCLVSVLCAAGMIWIDLPAGLAVIAVGAGVFCYYRYFSYKWFGGITGDLAGWFLQVFEAAVLITAAAAELITGVIGWNL